MSIIWKAIVVDDEPAARRILKRMIEDHKDTIFFAGEAESGAVAIELINKVKPDLLFLDIELQDMTGFNVLSNLDVQPHIIFTTAYEQYAIKAFEQLAIDYLLKPIREDRFSQSIEKLKVFPKANYQYDVTALQALVQSQEKRPTAFPVKIGEKIILIDFDSISFLEADDKYVNIFTDEGKKFLTEVPLTKLEDKLPSNFVRIQKSYIINKKKLKELQKYFNSRFIFVMNDKSQSRIKSGLTYYTQIKAEFGI